jgi:hypothetical protein
MRKINPRAHCPPDDRPSHPRAELRFVRGARCRTGTTPPRSRAGRPSSGIPPRSGAERPLERGPVSIERRAPPRASFCLARGHHGPAASIPAPPTEGFNALTFAGALVKDESTPRRTWESHPGTAPPTLPARPSPLCDAVRHGQQQPHGTVPPSPVRPTHRTLEKGWRSPRREDGRLLHTHTGQRRDVRPVGAVASIAIGPVRPSPPSRHHPGHYTNIPDAMEACSDRMPPRRLLCLVRPHANGALESSRGRPSNRRPLRRHPRSRSWMCTGRTMTPCQKQDSPGQPSTPWHCAPCLYT